jgi:hypothetical protein
MKRLISAALVLGALGVALAACGDTRSNKELSGVATWPGGGSAHGSWAERNPPPTYYGSSSDTVTTRTYPPAYYAPPPTYAPSPYPPAYAPAPYPPPPYPPPGGYR